MSVNTVEEKLVGECHVCGINVYDRGKLNLPFRYLGKERLGYPREVAMPCGINREGEKASKDLREIQCARCPFETAEEQKKWENIVKGTVFSGANLWDGIT